MPVLLSIPHSGRDYAADVLANAAQGRRSLETLEDPLVDRLCWRAIAAGFGAVIQTVPRAVIDCNRDEEEVDPAAIHGISPVPVGPRARYGLGLVPSRTHRHGALWRRPIDRAELARRIEQVHRPYHQALTAALDPLLARHGEVLLIDCHSMPSVGGPMDRDPGKRRVDFVLGDCFGASCAPAVMSGVETFLRAKGYAVGRNAPYAGGFTTRHYGRPDRGRHTLQIEINRGLYMDEMRIERSAGFAALKRNLDGLIAEVARIAAALPAA
jgi:N-formylglutamate amidohydrolase